MEHLDKRTKMTIMFAVMASMLFAALNQTIVGTSLPRIVAKLGGMEYFNWVFTIFMLTSSVTAILVGKLSDIYGRKPFILSGLAVFMAGSFLCGTSDDMIQLIIYRGIQGLGGGMIMSTSFTAVGDLFSPRERGRWQGLMGAVFGLASVLGPTLGGYIVEHFDWHWVFWIFLPFGFIAFFLIWRLFPHTAQGEKKSIDYWGSMFLVLTMIPLLLAFTWAGKDYGWTSARILGLFAFSAASLLIFIRIESRTSNPVLPLHLFKNSIFSLSNVIGFIMGIGMFGAVMYTPFFIQGVLGTAPSRTGFIMMFMTLSMVFSSTIAGQYITRTGKYKHLALFGLLLMAGGMYSMSLMGLNTSNWTVVINLAIVGLGLGIAFPIFNLTVQNAVDHRYLGVATSSTQLFRQMGGTVGVSIMGTLMFNRMEEKMSLLASKSSAAAANPGVMEKLSQLRDPQALLNPDKLEQIRSGLPPQMTGMFDHIIHALREAMSYSLEGVFFMGALFMILAFLLTFFVKEIPLRTSNREPQPAGDSQEQMGETAPQN
ncbi:MFS transporter [Marinithermofilum abyssi]|uniref:MFS transporter n=1 Tax=Marinithermofilum abyssi TaxID=1571185 RepID=A0A8J2VI35_9BACL|nr:MDR family MFS transporter [Marinithermofilum abyssi]GGE17655.1 MFS transporter [Marinithermofilum abyssi]